MSEFLDTSILDDFSNFIQEHAAYIMENDPDKTWYNLLCVTSDRLRSCVSYLNKHSAQPTSEENFVLFLTLACMVLDATKNLLKNLKTPFLCDSKNSQFVSASPSQYFKITCLNANLGITEENCPTDDKFFEYFRALAFAHPYKTSRFPSLIKKGSVHYSPFVIHQAVGFPHKCGLMVYTNQSDEITSLIFPFQTLKDYITSRYVILENITQHLKDDFAAQETEWKKVKIDRSAPAVAQYKEIQKNLEMRFLEPYPIIEAISYLNTPCTHSANLQPVTTFKNALEQILPKVCNAMESLDYETMYSCLDKVCSAKSKQTHQGCNYQIEKIFTSADEHWATTQAHAFSEEFAKKWVVIDVNTMQLNEIQLLVKVACYLEYKEQEQFHG